MRICIGASCESNAGKPSPMTFRSAVGAVIAFASSGALELAAQRVPNIRQILIGLGYTEVDDPLASDRSSSNENVVTDSQKQTTKQSVEASWQPKEEEEEKNFNRVTSDVRSLPSMLEYAAIYAYLPPI